MEIVTIVLSCISILTSAAVAIFEFFQSSAKLTITVNEMEEHYLTCKYSDHRYVECLITNKLKYPISITEIIIFDGNKKHKHIMHKSVLFIPDYRDIGVVYSTEFPINLQGRQGLYAIIGFKIPVGETVKITKIQLITNRRIITIRKNLESIEYAFNNGYDQTDPKETPEEWKERVDRELPKTEEYE